jgi:hypothetical protein
VDIKGKFKQTFFLHRMWLSKSEEFDAGLKSIEKIVIKFTQKKFQQKSNRKMAFLTFIAVCKSV